MLKKVSPEQVNMLRKDTLMELLDIQCIEVGDDYIVATMPVDSRTHQPMKLLHGGASAALIESVGSMGSTLLLDLEKEVPVGIEINANHVGGMSSGLIKGVGKVIHAGRRTHVWQVDLTNMETGDLICTGRLTVMVVPKKK